MMHSELITLGTDSRISYNTLCICEGYPCSCPGPSHGIPACADHELLTTVLRDEWKSKAYVVSDAGAIKFEQTDHEYAASQPAAAADAIAAGADLALGEDRSRRAHAAAHSMGP
jgi:beta-glucosidase-like glycosyl hydrolase